MICTKCGKEIDHLHAYCHETNKYEIELEECPRDVPIALRGKADVCLAGGPKTEEYPGGQFCSYLESAGKCKLEGDYKGLRWGRPEPMEGSATLTEFNCPECDHTLFKYDSDVSNPEEVIRFLKE